MAEIPESTGEGEAIYTRYETLLNGLNFSTADNPTYERNRFGHYMDMLSRSPLINLTETAKYVEDEFKVALIENQIDEFISACRACQKQAEKDNQNRKQNKLT